VIFACAKRFCATAFVEMMAPAIIGTLFNNERRQTPFLIELDGFIMRALLQAHLAGENLLLTGKVPVSDLHHGKARKSIDASAASVAPARLPRSRENQA
jgi:hypothetical protein